MILSAEPSGTALAESFQFPTSNHFLLIEDQFDRFFVGTAGKDWTSGQFGCVRSSGRQIHEGIDIRSVDRDQRDEPTDPILAAADGTVAYLNTQPGLSNYGNYIVLRHVIEGLEIHTLYAHLQHIENDLHLNDRIAQGQPIGKMGRTSNTRQRISKDRAHVHFEIGILASHQFEAWYEKWYPGNRNDHGKYHGYNLVGLDPARLFIDQAKSPSSFHFVDWVRNQPEAFRVFVKGPNIQFMQRFIPLVKRNPKAEQEGIVGFEIGLTFNGFPCQFLPKAPSEIEPSPQVIRLLSVNPAIWEQQTCRDFFDQTSQEWTLSQAGLRHIELLIR